MNRIGALAALALLLSSCASPPAPPDGFTFAVFGDTPYSVNEEKLYHAMLRRLDGERFEFIVHVGDIKSGSTPCTDELFAERYADLNASANPIVYTPGDNEWTDCRRKAAGSMNSLERLARLRQVFFANEWSLGKRRIATQVQRQCLERSAAGCTCGPYPENRAWTHGGVRFVTLNIPGSDNNVGFDAASDAEARCRNEANRQWLEGAAAASESTNERALAVFIQADPWETRHPAVYAGFLAQLKDVAMRLRKPVLFVHGDSHVYRFDTPFGVPYLARLETYGSPQVGWVRVTVDATAPEVFRAEPVLEGIALPGSKLR
jgi:hypothetical protein